MQGKIGWKAMQSIISGLQGPTRKKLFFYWHRHLRKEDLRIRIKKPQKGPHGHLKFGGGWKQCLVFILKVSKERRLA